MATFEVNGELVPLINDYNMGELMRIASYSGEYDLKKISDYDVRFLRARFIVSLQRKHPEWSIEKCEAVADQVDPGTITKDEEGPKALPSG